VSRRQTRAGCRREDVSQSPGLTAPHCAFRERTHKLEGGPKLGPPDVDMKIALAAFMRVLTPVCATTRAGTAQILSAGQDAFDSSSANFASELRLLRYAETCVIFGPHCFAGDGISHYTIGTGRFFIER
jgi:isopenicillin N synthase-like dioxygenase